MEHIKEIIKPKAEALLKEREAILKILIEDCKIFGIAGDDLVRINKLKSEIKELKKLTQHIPKI